jgi:hypothetical protein
LINFLSQFMLYSDGMMVSVVHTDYYGLQWLVPPDGYGRSTGWDLHPHAYAILLVLVICFARNDVPEIPLVSRVGWWVAAILLLWACLPTALDVWGFGTLWGFVSVIVALVAAFMHGRDRKKLGAASVTPAAPKP